MPARAGPSTVPLYWSPLAGPLRLPRRRDAARRSTCAIRRSARRRRSRSRAARCASTSTMTPRNPRARRLHRRARRRVGSDRAPRSRRASRSRSRPRSTSTRCQSPGGRQGAPGQPASHPPRPFRPTVIRVVARDAFGSGNRPRFRRDRTGLRTSVQVRTEAPARLHAVQLCCTASHLAPPRRLACSGPTGRS